MRRIGRIVVVLGVLGAALAWYLSAPSRLDPGLVAGLTGDTERGQVVFFAGGCAACHSAPKAEGDDWLRLGGGRRFASPFGTFVAPNISSDPKHGIGDWSDLDLANAMLRGVSPDGQHYYPAFPYTSYIRATPADIVDLRAYLATLPAVAEPSQPHEVGFPFNIRRGLGIWKLLFLSEAPVAGVSGEPLLRRGQYLVEALGHCAECHTSRNALGAIRHEVWLAGAPDPDGKGRVPNITPDDFGIGSWSVQDIAEYLTSGFTPDYESAGGLMIGVIENTSRLPAGDRLAIAAYLRTLPPLPTQR